MRSDVRSLAVLTIVAILAGSCGGTGATLPATPTATPETEVSTAPATPTGEASTAPATPRSEVLPGGVVRFPELTYHSGDTSRWLPARLDIYTDPDRTAGAPVVVLFHGSPGAATKDHIFYRAIAAALVEQGAVVFVPSWGGRGGFRSGTADEILDGMLVTMDGAACAVSYAIEHASTYGGDPSRLVILGHSAGAGAASVVGLREAASFAPCAVEPRPFEPDLLAFYEGDWLCQDTIWDQFGAGLSTVRDGITPWNWLEVEPKPGIVMVTSAEAPIRCEMESEGWYDSRDPDGSLRERLEVYDAFEDDCIEAAESAKVMGDVMSERGFSVEELFLPSSEHMSLSVEDLKALVQTMLPAR
jgi:hypothetical protein